jgi:ornithine cyclodeaminase/alanine dehydrogenase-like protein (mu-crystallin family)
VSVGVDVGLLKSEIKKTYASVSQEPEKEFIFELGAVLDGEVQGRERSEDITLFDSTGLAIQDPSIAKAALARADELDLPQLDP